MEFPSDPYSLDSKMLTIMTTVYKRVAPLEGYETFIQKIRHPHCERDFVGATDYRSLI